MDEKEILEAFNKDLHYLQLRYLYIPLNDYLWEHFLREQNEIREKYKVYGEAMDQFIRDILSAVSAYKEKKDGSQNKKDQRSAVQESGADGAAEGIWLHDQ